MEMTSDLPWKGWPRRRSTASGKSAVASRPGADERVCRQVFGSCRVAREEEGEAVDVGVIAFVELAELVHPV
jgi:hypothetical protein